MRRGPMVDKTEVKTEMVGLLEAWRELLAITQEMVDQLEEDVKAGAARRMNRPRLRKRARAEAIEGRR